LRQAAHLSDFTKFVSPVSEILANYDNNLTQNWYFVIED